MCGPNKLNRCHQHFSFQVLECSFASSFRKNRKSCLYFVLTVILLKSSTEAVAQRCSVKKACNFIEKNTLEKLFYCEFYETFKNTFSNRTPPVATFYSNSKD